MSLGKFLGSPLKLSRKRRQKLFAPARTILENRPLTEEEKSLLLFLLVNAGEEAAAFLPQIENAMVVGRCSCGCPTVDLQVSEKAEASPHKTNVIADVIGITADGRQVGVIVFAGQGRLSCLESYNLSESDEPWDFPLISSLREFSGEPIVADT